jgi:hypothetical protein
VGVEHMPFSSVVPGDTPPPHTPARSGIPGCAEDTLRCAGWRTCGRMVFGLTGVTWVEIAKSPSVTQASL